MRICLKHPHISTSFEDSFFKNLVFQQICRRWVMLWYMLFQILPLDFHLNVKHLLLNSNYILKVLFRIFYFFFVSHLIPHKNSGAPYRGSPFFIPLTDPNGCNIIMVRPGRTRRQP